MNPELQKQLTEILAELTDATTTATTWAQMQAGSLVHEKILFGRVWDTGEGLLFIALAMWCVRVCRRALTLNQADRDSCDIWIGRESGGILTLSSVGIAVFGFLALYDLNHAALAWFAPRLYIVEWLKSMVTQ